MALLTAFAPHSGPVDQPGEGAYIYARSGLARSATTRSNFVAVDITIGWIGRDQNGNIQFDYDITDSVLFGSLNITQAINDEPDSCSFTLKPKDWHPTGSFPPTVGQEIRIAWAPGGSPGVVLFYGFIVTTQSDWHLNNLQPPWISVQCQDPMWRFDARLVTYRFPAQSVSASIDLMVKWFCNAPQPHPLDFTTTYVVPNMPSIPAFDVTNQRPSTVMRTLLGAVNGSFYIDGLDVRAWPNSVSEPNQTNPTTLTAGLKTLHTFRLTDDAPQVRRRVLVEGRRTSTLIALPAGPIADWSTMGVPLQDATIFPLPRGVNVMDLARVGTQWMFINQAYSVTANGANPPQTKVAFDFTPGQIQIVLAMVPSNPPDAGWVRVGNQYARYISWQNVPTTGNWAMNFPPMGSAYAYGVFTAPIKAGDTIEWVDGCMGIVPHGPVWVAQGAVYGVDPPRAHPTDAAVVTLAYQQTNIPTDIAHLDKWPQLEGFVQDGRYAYSGAQARADADIAAFKDPLVSVEWETDDLNAQPGRSQVVDMAASDIFIQHIGMTVTILQVDITFPLRTLPPRRRCTGGVVKPSTFMDLVVTENT